MTSGSFALTETLAGVTAKKPRDSLWAAVARFLELSQMRRKYPAAGFIARRVARCHGSDAALLAAGGQRPRSHPPWWTERAPLPERVE